jgi:cytidylate kinase
MIIAIDGTLASGKGTLARHLARAYGLPHLDTGLIYRATAHAVLAFGADPDDAHAAGLIARRVQLRAVPEAELRTAAVGQAASRVAVHPGVRAVLLQLQRSFAHQPGGAVLDGRDIGTVVCPDADVKFWVDADVEVRADRRVKELTAAGNPISLEAMITQLRERDSRDANRVDAPMRAAPDAHLLDTTHKGIDAVVAEARRVIDAFRARAALSPDADSDA